MLRELIELHGARRFAERSGLSENYTYKIAKGQRPATRDVHAMTWAAYGKDYDLLGQLETEGFTGSRLSDEIVIVVTIARGIEAGD
jgi:transcriptional regulator with XRE-family HTH domain